MTMLERLARKWHERHQRETGENWPLEVGRVRARWWLRAIAEECDDAHGMEGCSGWDALVAKLREEAER